MKGFTLIEVIVIVAIIGILGAIVYVNLAKVGQCGENYRICVVGMSCEYTKDYTEKDGCIIFGDKKVNAEALQFGIDALINAQGAKNYRLKQDFPDTIYGYSLFQLKKIINFAKQYGWKKEVFNEMSSLQ